MTQPKVTIIVTTYLESSKRYLDLCMRSIEGLNYDGPLDVILVARQSYMPQYPGARTIAPANDKYYPAEGINLAMRLSHSDSKYFFILNDDCVVTKNSLKNLVEAVGDNALCANATSPCDNGLVYQLAFGLNGFDEHGNRVFDQIIGHQFRLEHFEGKTEQLMSAESLYPRGYVCLPYLCIFATLIPRKCYEAVGDWDEKFKCGQDDLDYSWRAQKAGYQTVAILDSLVWHFSGVTAEKTLNGQLRRENILYFKEKWSVFPPGINQELVDRL